MTSGKLYRAGLLGENISNSLSPYLHKILADNKGINLDYGIYDGIKNINDYVSEVRNGGYVGFNVTKPYKESFFDFVDEVDSSARRIGAVNVLALKNNKVIAYNTDFIGIYQALKRNGVEIKGKAIVVLGAGGAARSAVYAGAKYGASKIVIVNRTYENAKKISCDMESFSESSFECFTYDDFRRNNIYDDFILINATSVGMRGFLEESILDKELIKGASFFMDMIYSPFETESIKFANKNGLKNINGVDMLFFQGIRTFEIWTGMEFSAKEEDAAYKDFRDFCNKR